MHRPARVEVHDEVSLAFELAAERGLERVADPVRLVHREVARHHEVQVDVLAPADGAAAQLVDVAPLRPARGLEQIIQIKMTPEEDAAFKKSAAAVKELVTVIGV
jgi:malate/lactate dehydrogenase